MFIMIIDHIIHHFVQRSPLQLQILSRQHVLLPTIKKHHYIKTIVYPVQYQYTIIDPRGPMCPIIQSVVLSCDVWLDPVLR